MGDQPDETTQAATTPPTLAEQIVAKLEEKKALRKSLPMHLDRKKFLWLLKQDVQSVLDSAGGK